MKDVAVEGWYLENNNDANNTHKYYTVLVAENGVLIFAWGRIGTKGQYKIQKVASGEDAHTLGMKQFYAKRGRQYELLAERIKFVVSESDLAMVCEGTDASLVARAFHTARNAPVFERDKQAMVEHYDDFVTKAQALMSTAGSQNFDSVWAQYEQLQVSWAALEDKHAEASVTVQLLTQMLQQQLLTGALS